MQLFILFSIPVFFTHILYSKRDNLGDIALIRKRVVSGMLWALLAVIIFATMYAFIGYRINWLSLYLYSLCMFYMLPLLASVIFALKYRRILRDSANDGLLLIQSQLSGFFALFAVAVFALLFSHSDHIVVLFLPIVYLLMIQIVSRAMMRSLHLEIHWKFLMFFFYIVLFLALPAVHMLNGMVRPFLAWCLALVLITLAMLTDLFFTKLETDIQYRLALESRFKPFVRLFKRNRPRNGNRN